MARLMRKRVVLAKIESSYGVDPTPTGAANALLVSNLDVNILNAQNVSRDLIRAYFGGFEELVGTVYKEASFDVELASAGAAGTAPAWGPLLRACAWAETITGGNRVDYTPVTASLESVTIYYHADGVLHKLLGCRGTVQIKLAISDRPMLMFKFIGIDGGESATADATPTLTAWTTPLVVTNPNTGDLTFGCSYSAGSLSGGTAYPSRGVELDMGGDVKFVPMLGGDSVDITQREMTGTVQLDLTAAQEVTFMGTVKANTTQSVGLQHGSTAGAIIVVHAPAIQLINPKHEDVDGRLLLGFDMRVVPTSGNDELRIVAR